MTLHSQTLDQGLQPAPYSLRVVFVHIAHRYRLPCTDIHRHQHRAHRTPGADIRTIQPQHPYWLPLPPLAQLTSPVLHIPPATHAPDPHPQRPKQGFDPPVAQAQHSHQRRKLAQSLALLGTIHSLRIMPKGVPTPAAPVAIHQHIPHVWIPDFPQPPSPALKDFSFAARAVLRSPFGFMRDIRQFQQDNRHSRLRAMVG